MSANIPRISVTNSQAHCDFCKKASLHTNLISFSRMHSFGRNKNICDSCRMATSKFLRSFRNRQTKAGQTLQLPNHMNVTCPCGSSRKLPWSTVYRYTCICCKPFTPCTSCFRYICINPTTDASKRTMDSILDKHRKLIPENVKMQINTEAVIILLATEELLNTMKQDRTLEMYSKDISIHCVCSICGSIHCSSNIVFSSTLNSFLCTTCTFLLAFETQDSIPQVNKFIILIVLEHQVTDVLKTLHRYTSVSGGDAQGLLTFFTLGDKEGILMMAKGRDNFILGMPFLK